MTLPPIGGPEREILMAQARSRKQAAKGTLRPQIRIMFRKAIAMGPGKADLLQAIGETGSISGAARRMKMSYRRAWLLVDTMNQCFKSPVVETLTGGKAGGGAAITDFGREVLRRYRQMEAKATASVSRELQNFSHLLTDS